MRQRAWYYSRIYADTQNEDRVYVVNVSYHRSNDGGKSFQSFNAPHGDHHDLWIDPHDNLRMVMADDGGAQVSNDGGANWTTYHNQPTAQFYRVTTDNHFPFRIYGAQQDNSTIRILHRSNGNVIGEGEWEASAGGESAHLAPDPENPEIVYGGTYKGYMSRKDHVTGQTRSTNVWPFNPAGSGVEVMKYRFNWNFPLAFSPHDPDKLYAGSHMMHVSTNEGQSWQVISPDLTRGDPETLKSSGGPITQDNTGVEFYGTIFAFQESPHEAGVIWTGSDDGLIHLTQDGGDNWKEVTPSMAPDNIMWNSIDVDPFDKAGVYLAGTAYKFGDYTPYLYKSKDYGQTWTSITKGIDAQNYTRVVRADPVRPGLLYAGAEWGMYISYDDGTSWQPFQLNLPITAIRDLHIRDNTLIAATHGRSFWMIDDLSPVQQLGEAALTADFHLYAPKPAYRMAQGYDRRGGNTKLYGQNHPNGVILNYFVSSSEDSVVLEILEEDGSLIQSFANRKVEGASKLRVQTGGNRFVWDMRYPGFETFEGMVLYSSPNYGPKAIPGMYKARLSVNGQSVEQPFEILKDPRMPNSPDDYQKQFDFVSKVRDKVSEAHRSMTDIRSVKKNLDFLEEGMEGESYEEVKEKMAEYGEELTRIENTIHETRNQSRQDPLNYGIKINNHLAFLMQDQQRGDYPPTDQAEELFEELSGKLNSILEELQGIHDQYVPEINAKLKDLDHGYLPTKKEGS